MLRRKMRTKNFLIFLVLVVLTSFLFIILGPATDQNDSIKNIVSQTHQQIKVLQENLRNADEKSLEIDEKYLEILGFRPTSETTPKSNFSIVTYVRSGREQLDNILLFSQNVLQKLQPADKLLIYNLGLTDDDAIALQQHCNATQHCFLMPFDFSSFPSYIVSEEKMHAFRPLIIKDALLHANTILYAENNVRFYGNVTVKNFYEYKEKTERTSGVLGWTTSTKRPVSSRTHPKMFEYFDTTADNFLFLPMVSMEAVFFSRTPQVINKILLPFCKCALIQNCINPIGAQSGPCKYNKKPQYRYSGCHGYDESAFSILLGLVMNFDEKNYSISRDSPLFYTETLEQVTRILDNRRKNNSDASERPFTEI